MSLNHLVQRLQVQAGEVFGQRQLHCFANLKLLARFRLLYFFTACSKQGFFVCLHFFICRLNAFHQKLTAATDSGGTRDDCSRLELSRFSMKFCIVIP